MSANKKSSKILLALILILSLANAIYWGSRKEGYHVDEMYMYGTANSEYLPFMHLGPQEYSVKDWMHDYGASSDLISFFKNIIKDIGILKADGFKIKNSEIYTAYSRARECSNDMYSTGWMSGNDYLDYLTATEDSRFNYLSVYYNFRGDNHPPLYAMLLHTVCSFFPGQFSKWFGIGLNTFILLLTILMLYMIVSRFLGGDEPALMICALYGLSTSAVLSVTFIRMYALLTLSVLCFVYAHLILLGKNFEWDKKDSRRLILSTLLGYLSQYYFIIFAFFSFIAFSIIFFKNRKFKSFFRYLKLFIISAVTGLILWPFSLKAVFSGSRGAESFNSIFSFEDLKQRLNIMLGVLSDNSLGLPYPVFLILPVIFIAVAFILSRKDEKKQTADAFAKTLFIILPFVCYFLIVSKIVPYLVDRYIMCLFPLCFIIFVVSFACMIKQTGISLKGQKLILMLSLMILLFFSSAFRHYDPYLFEDGQETDIVAGNTDCIYVLPASWWNQSAEDTLLLSKCRNSAVVRENELDVLKGSYDTEAGTTLMIIVRDGLDTDSDVNYLIENIFPEGKNFSLTEKSRDLRRGRWVINYDLAKAL